MEDGYNTKEVLYGNYCHVCKNRNLPENEEPCEECLTNSMRYGSHKPIHFEKGVKTNARKPVSEKGQ